MRVPKLSRLKSMNYHVQGAMLEKYYKHQAKPKMTDRVESRPADHQGRAATRTRVNKAVVNLTSTNYQVLSAWLPHGCGCCQWWSRRHKYLPKRILRSRSSLSLSLLACWCLEVLKYCTNVQVQILLFLCCVLPWRLIRSEPSDSEKRSHSSRTMLQLTERATRVQSQHALVLSSNHGYSHPAARTLIRSTTKLGACCRDESMVPGSTVSTTLSSVLLESGIASTTESPSELFHDGVFDCVH